MPASGHPHDDDPVVLAAPRVGAAVNMSALSRRRTVHAKSHLG